jgi:cytosine/adenosine deaminase-related metal-dependent hydrolase
VLRLSGHLGVVQPGALADLVLLDMNTPAFTPLNDPFQHLVYAETGSSVRTVLVNGRIVVEEGRLLTVDEEAILAEAREVWKRRQQDLPPLSPEGRAFLQAQERFQQQVLARPFAVERY